MESMDNAAKECDYNGYCRIIYGYVLCKGK